MASRVGYHSFEADRYVPFVRIIDFYDIDLTAADMHMQVRACADAPGEPIWDLPKVINGNLMGLQPLGVIIVEGRQVTRVRVHIPEVELREHAPPGDEPGDDVRLAWDMIVTVDQLRRRILAGPFIIKAGVTQ